MVRTALVVLGLVVSIQACGSAPGSPTVPAVPSPTPSPTAWPSARADASALANLPLIRSLEAAARPASVLTTLWAAGVEFDGRASYQWSYVFQDSGRLPHNQWDVGVAGNITFHGNLSPIRPTASSLDLAPLLAIDSERAVQLAMGHGGRDYVRRYPSAKPRLTARWSFGLPVWQVRFFVPEGGVCEAGPIEIHATTGEFVGRDWSCFE